MGSVTITRENAPWRDRLRAYRINIDGKPAGAVKSGETVTVLLDPGMHRLYLGIDWLKSSEFEVSGAEDHRFHCRAGGGAFSALTDILFRADRYISLEKL